MGASKQSPRAGRRWLDKDNFRGDLTRHIVLSWGHAKQAKQVMKGES